MPRYRTLFKESQILMRSRSNMTSFRQGLQALKPLALVAATGIVGTVTLLGGCGGGGGSDPDPTPTVQPSTIPTTSPTPTPSGSTSPTPTPSGSTGPTPTPTPTGPTPTPTPTRTPTPTPTPIVTPTPTPTPPVGSSKLDTELQRLSGISAAVVSVVALAPDDRWLVAYDDTPLDSTDGSKVTYPADAPVTLRNKLAEIKANGGQIRAAALGTGDIWVVAFTEDSTFYTQFEYNGIASGMLSRLNSLVATGNANVNALAIGPDPNTWVITLTTKQSYYNSIPSNLQTQLSALANNATVSSISDVVIGTGNSWAVIYNNNKIAASNIDNNLFDFINNTSRTIQVNNYTVNAIALGQFSTSYAMVYRNNVPFVGTLTRSR
jgi:hypothetical protein